MTPEANPVSASAESTAARRLARVVAVVVFAALVLANWTASNYYETHLLDDARVAVTGEAVLHARGVALAVERWAARLDGLHGLVLAHLEYYGEVSDEEFHHYAKSLSQDSPGARLIISPGGVNRHVYPPAEQVGAIGWDLTTDPRPEVREEVELARSTRSVVLCGPRDLRLGGQGLILRRAVSFNDESWGLVSLVVDLDAFLREVGLHQTDGSLRLSLRNEQGVFIGGEPMAPEDNPVVLPVNLLGRSWELAAAPRPGWPGAIRRPLHIFRLAGVGIAVLVSILVFRMVGREIRLSTAVARDTAEREARERRTRPYNELLSKLIRLGETTADEPLAILPRIIEESAAVLATERVSVWFYNSDHSQIRCHDLYERSVGRHRSGEVLNSSEFPEYTRSHRVGQVIAAEDVYTDPRTCQIPAAYWQTSGATALLDAPIWVRGRLTALLSFEHVEGRRRWLPDEEHLALTLAAHISACIEAAERRRAETALQRQVVALTQPLDDASAISFATLFNVEEIQRIQDAFAEATGVASIITHPDGTPITRPSRFCRLCIDVIRKTEKGLANCYCSDAAIGRHNPTGPVVQPCLSGGLWDAGASISVGGKHIANWLIGQVKNNELDLDRMQRYAAEIGADPVEFKAALAEVPVMSREQFEKIARALYILANELSLKAYQNVQQARFITERQRIETELRRHRENLEELVAERTRTLKETQAELRTKEKLAAVGQLVATVSHEIRNPLATIRSSFFTVRHIADERGVDLSKPLDRIERNITRCDAIIAELLDYTRARQLQRTNVPLDAWLKDILDEEPMPDTIRITPGLAAGVEAWIDPDRLRRCVLNILSNAIHAIEQAKPERPELRVESRVLDDRVELIFIDNGSGISEEDLTKVGEPFFSTKGFGVGLGLAVVRQIAEQHGGGITLTSRPGEGTAVTLWVPLRAPALHARTTEPADPPATASSAKPV